MSAQFFSPDWPEIASLKPALRSHIKVHRQVVRDHVWHILEDEATGKQHRLDELAWEIASRLDGRLTLEQLWTQLLDRLGESAPGQGDIIRLIGTLHQADLIRSDLTPDTEELFHRRQRQDKQALQSLINPLAFRVPLFNPTPLLTHLERPTRWMFHGWTLLAILLLAGTAAITASQHWAGIAAHAATHLPSGRFWMLTWLLFPVLKLCHELGHALAVRHWGGRVEEIGISLLVLMPVPYVDASAANLFPDRHARMVVSAAGILVEVTLASLALFLWLAIDDSLLREAAFVVMTVGGLSTILFNANPLVRFDGYHLLADWLEIPDLANRSRQYWIWLGKHYLWRIPRLEPPALHPGERPWLLLYAPASWLYRWLVLIVISTWFANISLLLATGITLAFLHSLLLKPSIQLIRYLWHSPEPSTVRGRALLKTGLLVTAVSGFLLFTPMPFTTLTQAVVQAPDESRLRARASGFISRILVEPGATVHRGQPLIELQNDLLLTRRQRLEARLKAIDTRIEANRHSDRAKMAQLKHESEKLRAELSTVIERSRALTILSLADGHVVIPHYDDLMGRFVKRGEVVGYVLGNSNTRLSAVIAQPDAVKLSHYPTTATLRLSGEHPTTHPVVIQRIHPAATHTLPDAALAYSAGGPFLTDPNDQSGLKTVDAVIQVDLLAPGLSLERIGQRAWLRFDHGDMPLLQQWLIRWKQILFQHFSSRA